MLFLLQDKDVTKHVFNIDKFYNHSSVSGEIIAENRAHVGFSRYIYDETYGDQHHNRLKESDYDIFLGLTA